MTTLFLLNMTAASIIFVTVAWRMMMVQRSHPSIACRARWLIWTAWHVLVGVGAFGILTGPLYGYTAPRGAEVLINTGLATYFMLRWNRHSVEEPQAGQPS